MVVAGSVRVEPHLDVNPLNSKHYKLNLNQVV